MLGIEKYKAVEVPPEKALRAIEGGRQAGKTDINPQWRIEAMTNTYGLCGVGWKYEIEKQWSVTGANNEIMVFTNVSLYIKDGDNWSDPIPGTGGNTLIEKERNGMHNNDDAFKMSLTDALSVAMKALGVGAEVYRGNFDGCKYLGKGDDNGNQGAGKQGNRKPGNSGSKGKTGTGINDDEVLRELAESNLDHHTKGDLKKKYLATRPENKMKFYQHVIRNQVEKAGKKTAPQRQRPAPEPTDNTFQDNTIPFENNPQPEHEFTEDPIPEGRKGKKVVGQEVPADLFEEQS